jgi:hypothetical protein
LLACFADEMVGVTDLAPTLAMLAPPLDIRLAVQ